MFDLRTVPDTDPVDIYRVRDGIYAADMLLAAIVHLDLFSWLDGHPASRDDVCRHFETTARPTDVMLTLFAAMGFVAVFAGATNTPIACTVMAVELFGAGPVVPVAIACVLAYVCSSHRGIYTSQRIAAGKGGAEIAGHPRLADWVSRKAARSPGG